MKNAFTIDLEDWFCSHNLLSAIQPQDWDALDSRIERNTEQLLLLLQKNKTSATFFVLGWIADKYPELIKTIFQAGHEIGSHGYAHQQVSRLNEEEFRTDIKRSVSAIVQAAGVRPLGYRAPAFSINRNNPWAFKILKENGFEYDSSVYPVGVHPEYGDRQSPLDIHFVENDMVEVPLSCTSGFGLQRIPCSGGAYLRFYPYHVFRFLARRITRQNRPFIFYIHPWEIDASPVKVSLPLFRKLRHYYNVENTAEKLNRLLGDFEFTTVGDLLKHKNLHDHGNNRTGL